MCVHASLHCQVRDAAGGVNMDTEADKDVDATSQPMSKATSDEMLYDDDQDMKSGSLSSWLLLRYACCMWEECT